jgi:hypothetical protein
MIRPVLISLCLAILTASPALSQDQNARLRTGGSTDNIVATETFNAAIFARRLGHVSAITRHADGTIYTADRDGGRIFRIQDRRMDGVADITQPLPHRFDRPTGLALAGDILFVADQGGLWRVQPGGGTPELIAPFANSGSTGDAHPITMIAPTSLLLGLSRTDGTARLLTIDTVSGSAQLREEGLGTIVGFSSAEDTGDFPAPWIIMRRGEQTLFGSSLQSARNIDIDAQGVWIDITTARARVSLPGGVYETVATFAGLTDTGSPILNGFSGDARPGTMVSDARGLFVSDQAGGHVWRLYPKPAIMPPEPETVIENAEPEAERPVDPAADRRARPELMRGSGINSASTLGRASTMPPASTIPEADQPRSASDPSE